MAKKAAAKTFLPDEIRCRRSDGRGWRCSRRVVDGKTVCEVHLDQRRRHDLKQRVPDHLKLKRKTKKSKKGSSSRIPQSQKPTLSEIVEKAVRIAGLKNGDGRLELLREYLKTVVQNKKKNLDDEVVDQVLMLPYGEMTISMRNPDTDPMKRTFRSKTIEPLVFQTPN